jgi:hypothetical protein
LKNYTVVKYSSKYYTIWNQFVSKAKNATFLFFRDFMEYHQDRFDDFSLLVFDEKNNIKALLPANRTGDVVFSHQGLTYGGIIIDKKCKLSDYIEIIREVLSFLCKQGIHFLEIKVLPSIYAQFPSDELEYLAFLLDAKLTRRDTLSVIDLNSDFKFSQSRKQEISKGKAEEFEIKEVEEFSEFWNKILIPNLKEKHQSKPVHSLEEITLLKSRFPKNIRQFNIYKENKIVAGTTVFETEKVVHSQYISGNKVLGRLESLDVLHDYLISNVFVTKKYFDFGISNENQGKNINHGLLFWKESFGARTIAQSFYRFETSKFIELKEVML